ncbi:MAG: Maf family protein [Verrucomicrobiae bacterium]|nr:Maf family protein [Verrucomicrobiae bacterium]
MKRKVKWSGKLIILASASPRRMQLLQEWGVPHQIKIGFCRELTQRDAPYFTARELTQINALIKAKAVAEKVENRWILAADTVVVLNRKILGKPKNLKAAYNMLCQLSGQVHEVISSVLVLKRKKKKIMGYLSYEISQVRFHSLKPKQIRHYLKQVHVLDKAGAYAVQEKGGCLIRAICGSRSNVMGLPKRETLRLLRCIL